jgi:hypothetical protein
MDVRLPDGTLIKDVPEGTTKAQLTQKLRANGMAVPAEWLGDAPASPADPTLAQKITGDMRRVGLTARYGLEGLVSIGDIVHEPIRAITNAVGLPRAGSSLTQLATKAADAIGLPAPRDSNERVIGDASRMMAGAGGMAAGTAAAAGRAAPGVLQEVLAKLSANAGSQAAGAAGAGLAGGSVREEGGGSGAQFAASLAGGLAGGLGANALSNLAGSATNKIKQMLTPAAVEMAAADQKITMILERSGIDWSQVPERIRQGMRQEVTAAMNTGAPLDEKAIQRLLVFKRAEVAPTVGQLKQNPGMITREKNLAKSGANSTSPALQALPELENRNVQSLLNQLDDAGARGAPSASGAGMASINSLDALASRAKGNINQLYQGARDTSGRSLPLEGGTFTRNANLALDEANVGSFLPPDIVKKMNAIARGEYPLTVDVAEQLKTSIGNLQRGSADGNMRRALGIVRQALDDAPLQNSSPLNPGRVPAVPGTVPASTAAAGEESLAAFNAARKANREWMQRVENNPALKAVVDGVEPDQFVQKYVIGKGASAADVAALKAELDPSAAAQMRAYLVRHLKDKATGGDEDITKFAGKTYRDALRELGDKLPVFFSKDEIQKLNDLGNAAKYMQAQPAGSAVNNSNSGALIIGRGLDMLESLAQKAPIGRGAITGVIQGMQQRQVLAPRNALAALAAPQNRGLAVNPLTAAVVATPSAYGRDNNRRD